MSDDTKGRHYRPPAFRSGHAALEYEAREAERIRRERDELREQLVELREQLERARDAMMRASVAIGRGDVLRAQVVLEVWR